MSTIDNAKNVYFKASDDKTGKFCLGAQDLTNTGIRDDSNLLNSFRTGTYAYYKDTTTTASDGQITPNYSPTDEKLLGTYVTPENPDANEACPSLKSSNIIYNVSDVDCNDPDPPPGCNSSAANTCLYSQAPASIWTCDWSKGCIQLTETESEEKKTLFNNRINFPRAKAMYPNDDVRGNPKLQTYTSKVECQKQCAGPYSRCNTNIEGEKAPGYPSWNLEEPIHYDNGYKATTQNWFYCDKNIHCHGYKDQDPCFCSLPKSIPKPITNNSAFPQYDWQVLSDLSNQNGGAFDNLGTATPYQYYTNNDKNVQPTNGNLDWSKENPEVVYESQNWFHVDDSLDPTADRQWLFTTTHNYWPNLCDFTNKEIKYQCHDRQDQLMSTGFCGSPGLKPTDEHTQDNHRIGMMTGYGPVNFYSNECKKNDLSAVQLPNYTNKLQILTSENGYYLGNGYPGKDPADMWGSIPPDYIYNEGSPGKYADKRLELGAWAGKGALTFKGFSWDHTAIVNGNPETTIAPFNCVRTPAAHPVYDVGKTSEVSGT